MLRCTVMLCDILVCSWYVSDILVCSWYVRHSVEICYDRSSG